MRLLLLLLLVSCTPPESIDFVHVALVATHADLSCTECHGDDVQNRSGWQCASCHASDRPAVHDDGECGECHSLVDWSEAGVDHSLYFPIPHRGVDECSECHLDPSDRSVFSCIDCHEHRRSEMDDEHDGEAAGYSWSSEACLDCHPNGREEDGDDG